MQAGIRLAAAFALCAAMDAQALPKAAVREATRAVEAVLDDWHAAAAKSEEERYFAHMSPEAVFLGLDEQERWTKDEFRKWSHRAFEARQIWSFRAIRRNVILSPGGDTAWFDELLETTTMGKARGTGVLVKHDQTWRIAQYCLSLTIPRNAFAEIRSVIDAVKTPLGPGEPDSVEPEPPESGPRK